jgi:pseudouridine-5'-phosphate glycosidase
MTNSYSPLTGGQNTHTLAVEATEEEEYNGCNGADPQCRLDDTLLSMVDGILLRSVVATTAGAAATAVGSTVTVTMLMSAIDVIAVHWVGGLGGRQRQQRRDRG